MKMALNWNEQFRPEKLVALKEALSSIGNSYSPCQIWIEDLAIFMGYNYCPTHPSVRLCRLNLRKPLRDLGVRADIIYRYEDLEPYNNILISHFDDTLAEYCERWRKQGKRIFFSHTEHLWGLPSQVKVFNLCDYIVCCSNTLAELTQTNLTSKFTKCHFIPDMAERPKDPNSSPHQPQNERPLRCVYVGMGGNSYLAHDMRPMIESLGMTLTVITEWDNADIKWDQDTYLDIMTEHDIALCPQRVREQPAKSHVKVSTAMSRGMPVIASPSPAYKEIIEHGENGFIADTPEEWRDCLIKLQDFQLRKRFSQNALKTAQTFTPHAIAFYWLGLLTKKYPSVALINNTLRQKYLSYGDNILDELRFNGYTTEEFRYQDVDRLPKGFDAYLFIEDRYDPATIADVSPKILYTREDPDLNTLPHFDLIVSQDPNVANKLRNRGFVNVFHQSQFGMEQIFDWTSEDLLDLRKKHNQELHSKHIDQFHHLQQPENRWTSGARDIKHIEFAMEHTEIGSHVLDIGSADGWLSLYLAKQGRNVSAIDFVERGMNWTREHAKRLNVDIDLRFGFAEDVANAFRDKTFNTIMAFEILEHLDYLRVPWYLMQFEKLLRPGGKILISLPKQDLRDNPEHLWSPNEALIAKIFKKIPHAKIKWIPFDNYDVPGDWFISYEI